MLSARSIAYGVSFLLTAFTAERPAAAQQSMPETAAPSVFIPGPSSLWRSDWPQFSNTEGILTVSAGIATAAIVIVGPIERPRWQGGILFDDAVRDEIRGRSRRTRQRFRTVGDYTYHLSPVLPLMDVLVAAIAHSDSKAAKNLGFMALEAYSYSGLASFVTTEISARARPDGDCVNQDCNTQSFFSGHSAIAATAAGLVCANHSRIALYGNSVADAAACVLASANALATASTRVVADRHYATDVITGTGVGFAFGYAVPVLLHYARPGRTELAFGPDPSCPSCVGVSGTF